MATKKSASKSKKSAPAKQAAARTGALPPYGVAIRDAITRGDAKQMKAVAASARKYLKDVQSALDKLDKALGK